MGAAACASTEGGPLSLSSSFPPEEQCQGALFPFAPHIPCKPRRRRSIAHWVASVVLVGGILSPWWPLIGGGSVSTGRPTHPMPAGDTGSGEPQCTSIWTSSQCAVRTPLLHQVPWLTFPSGHPARASAGGQGSRGTRARPYPPGIAFGERVVRRVCSLKDHSNQPKPKALSKGSVMGATRGGHTWISNVFNPDIQNIFISTSSILKINEMFYILFLN